MIDEIVRKIYEEDQRYQECALRLLYGCTLYYREVEARLEKQRATKQYIEEFLQKREEVNLNLTRLPHIFWKSLYFYAVEYMYCTCD